MKNMFNFIFDNEQINIDFDKNGFAWFRGPEIAKVLEYEHAAHMYRMLNDSEKLQSTKWTSGQNREIIMINEPGLYRCIFNSRSLKAVEFQNRVFNEVLPSIRMYGAYIDSEIRQMLNKNPNYIHELNNKIDHMSNLKQMCHVIDKTKYPYNSYENLRTCLLGSSENITIATLAKLLCNAGYPIDEHKLYEELRNDGYLIKFGMDYNKPYQNVINSDLMSIVKNPEYDCNINPNYYITVITPKGVEYFTTYFLSKMNG